MGNRAVMVCKKAVENGRIKPDAIGVYLHWNGDRNSVEGFLAYCRAKGYRRPEDDCYGWAYLTMTICNFFGNGLSCGVDIASRLDCDNGDNGVYVIEDWKITGRLYAGEDKVCDNVYLRDMLRSIDDAQPAHIRLGWNMIDKIIEEKEKEEGE